jgi:hypothetical protein
MPDHTPSILDILTHTPLWAWAAFALVLVLGLQRTQDRTVALWRLLILPVVMVVTAATGIVGSGWAVLPAILVGIAIGGTAGWLLERDGATRRLANGKLWLRGEWWSFVQVLLIFVFRYTATVIGIVNPVLGSSLAYHLLTALISSLLSAIFLGRTAARLAVYFRSQPITA